MRENSEVAVDAIFDSFGPDASQPFAATSVPSVFVIIPTVTRYATQLRALHSNSPEIETDSLQAVKSLRSKFEKLALAQPTTNCTPQRPELLTVTAPSSPRPRANSNAADGVHLRSTSDVLSLEGVNERLWAGSRNGMISAYDGCKAVGGDELLGGAWGVAGGQLLGDWRDGRDCHQA
ncbi:hypothetical protein B0H34DRAFT_802700 [Crassisporium funariophilum]|nr:hypothetical protein B0H34DRAFT_803406 [Crassisporium funariophilum]KAF8148801.1 hypothetical protein B0H34DRAFT_802700 [Crassisporium funariophilum]